MSQQFIHPYPIGARVRVGFANARWGSVIGAAISPEIEHPVYKVRFDDDTTADVTQSEIANCFVGGVPVLQVLVDAEIYTRFHAEGARAEFVADEALCKNHKSKKQAECSPVLWRDQQWVVIGGAFCFEMDDGTSEYTYLEIEQVVPRAEWQGEIVGAHYSRTSHYGHVVLTADGEFVATGVFAHIARLGPPPPELVRVREAVVVPAAKKTKPPKERAPKMTMKTRVAQPALM